MSLRIETAICCFESVARHWRGRDALRVKNLNTNVSLANLEARLFCRFFVCRRLESASTPILKPGMEGVKTSRNGTVSMYSYRFKFAGKKHLWSVP